MLCAALPVRLGPAMCLPPAGLTCLCFFTDSRRMLAKKLNDDSLSRRPCRAEGRGATFNSYGKLKNGRSGTKYPWRAYEEMERGGSVLRGQQ